MLNKEPVPEGTDGAGGDRRNVFHTARNRSNGTFSLTILLDIILKLCHHAVLLHEPAGLPRPEPRIGSSAL
jgi:hypothetical protein